MLGFQVYATNAAFNGHAWCFSLRVKGSVLASTLPIKSLCFQLMGRAPVLLTPGGHCPSVGWVWSLYSGGRRQQALGVRCHGDCGRMREQEEQNGSISLWRRKGAAGRVSHSRGVEVSWSLRQDGLEGLWCKQGMVGREGGRGRSGLEDWCAD